MQVNVEEIVRAVFAENVGRSVEMDQTFDELGIDSLNRSQIFLDLEERLAACGLEEISKQTENDLYDDGRGTPAQIAKELKRMLPYDASLFTRDAPSAARGTKYRHNIIVACPLLGKPFRSRTTRHAGLVRLEPIM